MINREEQDAKTTKGYRRFKLKQDLRSTGLWLMVTFVLWLLLAWISRPSGPTSLP